MTTPEIHTVDNGAGWRLSLKRVPPSPSAAAFAAHRANGGVQVSGRTSGRVPRPVILVPGYQMNSFIFGFHATGPSLEQALADHGIEVWSADLRGQGRAQSTGGDDVFGLGELAVDDLGAVVRYVQHASESRHDGVDLLGCSLGSALAFAHVACTPGTPVRSVVSMGGVVTWVHVSRLLRLAAHAPWLIGRVRMRGSRELARVALPIVVKTAPWLLSIYLNPRSTDTSKSDEMVQTVEDPNPYVNREIAEWIARRALVVRGVNVTEALRTMDHPFLCVIGNQDGVVPPKTARATFDAIGSSDKKLLAVGDARTPIAHADLFLARIAPERVFRPIAEFLVARA